MQTRLQQIEDEQAADMRRLRADAENWQKDQARRVDHLKYFHEHLLKRLHLDKAKYAGQLDARLNDMARESDAHARQLQLENERSAAKTAKKMDHLKYFHEHILKKLKLKLEHPEQ